jgi:phenylalanyl-tRNA synthetase beta chain
MQGPGASAWPLHSYREAGLDFFGRLGFRSCVGFDIPAADMRAAFEALEFTITREEPTVHPARGPAWTVGIPSWRDDLDRPIDLVEEVLRLYGTDKIPAAVVSSPGLVGDDDPIVRFNRRVTDYLVGHDFNECVTYTLRPAQEIAAWVSATAAQELALANPFVEDQSHLRPTLITGLLESLKLNQSRGVAATHLCETGRIFIERNGQNVECAAVAFLFPIRILLLKISLSSFPHIILLFLQKNNP